MRVTEEVRRQTRARLLGEAERLVRERGFDSVTTRDVAAAAGVGHGTLFNYFPSREAMGLALCDVLLARAEADDDRRRERHDSLEEALFAHVAACLRRLKPLRTSAGALLAGVLPLTDAEESAPEGEEGDGRTEPTVLVRRRLGRAAERILAGAGGRTSLPPTARQLWASLVVGVVCAWARDASPHQEDTLALLDQATRLFVASLDGGTPSRE